MNLRRLTNYLSLVPSSVREHRAESLERSQEIASANRSQRLQLLMQSAPKDVNDLIPILAERARKSREQARKDEQELADALLMSELNREAGRA